MGTKMKFVNLVVGLGLLSAGLGMTVQGVSADEIKMTFSGSTPPYTFPETKGGIEVDIIREALAVHGHTLTPIFVPAKRILFDFKLGEVDAASKDHAQKLDGFEAFYGDVYVQFHDVIFSIEDRNLEISNPEDLETLRIVAFQTAPDHYPEWLDGVKDSANYSETADQSLQVKMLHRGRTDVIVADQTIIGYLTKKLSAEPGMEIKPTKITNFADPWGYKPLFRSEELRDQFNDGLRQIIESGKRQAIIDKYTN